MTPTITTLITWSEKSVRPKVALLTVFAIGFLGGCALHPDPWAEMSAVSSSPSKPFAAGPAFAYQTPEVPGADTVQVEQELTLPQCVRIALEHNPRTTGSWQAARAAAARVGQAKSAYLPTVGFTSSAARGNPAELDGKTDSGSQNTFESTFGVRYLLFDGAGREARVRGAEGELLTANFRYNVVLQEVAFTVAESYYDLLAAQAIEALARETIQQREYHVRLANARYKTGLVAKSDVLKAQTEKADADLALVQAQNAVRLARGGLASVMGLRVSQAFEIAGLPEDVHRQEPADIEALLDEAARNRPELRAALAQIETQRANVRSTQARYWPTFSIDSKYGWMERTFPPGEDQWNLGLSVDIPLFTGFDRTYQVQQAQADLARSIAEHKDMLHGVELEVWTAYSEVIEASRAIDAAVKLVASADESARVAEGEYKNGAGAIIDLIDAQKALTAALTRLIQAKLDRHKFIARFERAVGRSFAAEVGGDQLCDEKEKP